MVDILKIMCFRTVCGIVHNCSTRVSDEYKYSEKYMDDDYFNLDVCTGTSGECWRIDVDKVNDKFVLMRKKKDERVYTSIKYKLVLDNGSDDTRPYKASVVVEDFFKSLRDYYPNN